MTEYQDDLTTILSGLQESEQALDRLLAELDQSLDIKALLASIQGPSEEELAILLDIGRQEQQALEALLADQEHLDSLPLLSDSDTLMSTE